MPQLAKPSRILLRFKLELLQRVKERITAALSTCAPGREREAVLAALAEVEREVEG